jgi:hypothetical protein
LRYPEQWMTLYPPLVRPAFLLASTHFIRMTKARSSSISCPDNPDYDVGNSQEDPHIEARRLAAFSTVRSVRLLFTYANILEQLYGCESPLHMYTYE